MSMTSDRYLEQLSRLAKTVPFGSSFGSENKDGYSEESEENNDVVNHPSHYTLGEIECIDAIKASMSKEEFVGYLKGNCVKYLWRYRLKGKEEEDLRKAQWYLDRLVNEWQ